MSTCTYLVRLASFQPDGQVHAQGLQQGKGVHRVHNRRLLLPLLLPLLLCMQLLLWMWLLQLPSRWLVLGKPMPSGTNLLLDSSRHLKLCWCLHFLWHKQLLWLGLKLLATHC